MDVQIPTSSRRQALFIIDVQSQTLAPKAKALIPSMVSLIAQSDYAAYIEANYFADEDSMFFKQGGFSKSREDAGTTAPELREALSKKTAPRLLVEKNTRSCFKAKNATALHDFLNRNQIEEAHFIGYDINDCVLASAYDAIDLGYFTYVIEELCHHWDGIEALKEAAIAIYRRQNMSNNGEHQAVRVVSV